MNKPLDIYDVYDMICIIKSTIEENLELKKENKRLRGIVEDYDKWVRDMNSRYQKNIGNILTTLITKSDEEI